MATIKGLIFGMILISVFAIIFGSFYSGLNSDYENTEYDSSSLQTLNTANNMTDKIEEIRDSLRPQYDANILDILGAYFKAGYNSIYISFQSVEIFDSVSRDIAKESGLPTAGGQITDLLIGLMIIAVIFVILAALLKYNV